MSPSCVLLRLVMSAIASKSWCSNCGRLHPEVVRHSCSTRASFLRSYECHPLLSFFLHTLLLHQYHSPSRHLRPPCWFRQQHLISWTSAAWLRRRTWCITTWRTAKWGCRWKYTYIEKTRRKPRVDELGKSTTKTKSNMINDLEHFGNHKIVTTATHEIRKNEKSRIWHIARFRDQWLRVFLRDTGQSWLGLDEWHQWSFDNVGPRSMMIPHEEYYCSSNIFHVYRARKRNFIFARK